MNYWDKLVTIPYGAFPKDGEPFTALSGKRENIVALLKAMLANQQEHKLPEIGFVISMPCGYGRIFREPSDIPLENLPCLCDKPERFLITLF